MFFDRSSFFFHLEIRAISSRHQQSIESIGLFTCCIPHVLQELIEQGAPRKNSTRG
jgi:hypothetical protein